MSEIDKKYLDVAILTMLSHSSMTVRDIMHEFHQHGIDYSEPAINSEVQRLVQTNLISIDETTPSKYATNAMGKDSLSKLLSIMLNHVNSGIWENMASIRDGVIKSADIKPGNVILDCSSGIADWFCKELSPHVGSTGQVIFFTQDPAYNLEYFEKLITTNPQYCNITYIPKSEFIGRIESNTIDAVFQIFGFHLYENIGVIMQEIGRILKPGKKIVICDPLEIEHYIYNQFRRMLPSMHMGITPENLRTILNQTGFQNIVIDVIDGLCIATAEKGYKVSGLTPLEPLVKTEDEEKEKEKHYYRL